MTAITYKKDQDNIVTLTMDMPNQSANTMNEDFREAFTTCIEKLETEKQEIAGVIIASAKKTFFAGGDLNELIKVTRQEADAFQQMLRSKITGPLRRLETLGKPVVAVINGAALGGGWELCLACHHRIALNSDKVQIGLPEVTLGLLPGGGGTVRMTRMLGLEKAFPYLMEGKKIRPAQALTAGLIDSTAESIEEMHAKARQWIKENPTAKQPWDEKGFKLPGGLPSHPKVAQMLAIAPAMLKNKTRGCYPAPEAIMSAAVEGAQVDFDTAQIIENRYFTQLVISQVAKNMVGTFWFQLNEIKAGFSRPKNVEKSEIKKVGVLGAGMMGSGIAYACAIKGIDVVLKDTSQENADKGKSYSDKILTKKVQRKHMTEDEKNSVMGRIKATDNNQDLQGCDLIIEAVFEDSKLKALVTKETEPQLCNNGIFASNTSTIPITQLAEAAKNATNFIGLHFFSPVDKMPLVEIITGKNTSEETLARAFDFVLQINKTPIVVNDSRGFFTSRVFGTFVNEGVAMLSEGHAPSSIENAALLAGMPVGPLALCDEVSLNLITHIRDQTKADIESTGTAYQPHPAEAVIDKLFKDCGRAGKAGGAGFYEYPAGGKKYLWPGLTELFVKPEVRDTSSLQDLKDRILFIQAIETVRCLEENVLRTVQDANIGSIFGIGFAPWTGGAIQFINQYGVPDFVDRAHQLAEKYGARFTPPSFLLEKSGKGESFS
ncbi:MAG: enoyl-CoA hydratase/isomerase family protein [Hahellaceae bacterium]|nr:enoyl-CoA hydratase/isomerase family protein [Hahellaceae bacterium]MCP5212826.1 enoyl-CoA hydratase/isomerase family protein [Hahellaceae bacterium]